MNQVTIDGVQYELNTLSENAKQQLINLQVTDAEIARLQTQLQIVSTARMAYAAVLRAALS